MGCTGHATHSADTYQGTFYSCCEGIGGRLAKYVSVWRSWG